MGIARILSSCLTGLHEFLEVLWAGFLFVLLEMGFWSRMCRSTARLDGKTALITGANTGIGKETAKDFSRRGARVLIACRDVVKAEAAADEIRAETDGKVIVYQLDLNSLNSVRACAKTILESETYIHLLVNNAGVMACPKGLTEDGFETQFAVNHLGHFLLTNLLLPRIVESAPARIVNVSSLAHFGGRINFSDINSEKHYYPGLAYAQSKLANILFTRELAKRLQGTQVTVYSLHPGVVNTELSRHLDTAFFSGAKQMFNAVARKLSKTPVQGAQTSIYCAVDEKLAQESGHYYSNCKRAYSTYRSRNSAVAKRLWDVSSKMVGLVSHLPALEKDKVA